jgi:hypothetical protein
VIGVLGYSIRCIPGIQLNIAIAARTTRGYILLSDAISLLMKNRSVHIFAKEVHEGDRTMINPL